MAGNVTFDTSDFDKKSKDLLTKMQVIARKAVMDVANEVLRLSTFEVPFDKGLLQASGNVEQVGDNADVGYNKVYAARLHEHPEYHFQHGRKGKYLEDPIKRNLQVLGKYMQESMAKGLV